MDDVTLLKKAKSLIENEENWTQEGMYVEDGCMCTVGAIMLSLQEVEYASDLSESNHKKAMYIESKLDVIVRREFQYPYVVSFNDNPKTKHQDVMKLFDIAIEEFANEDKEQ